jgi:hypothetical protein
VSSIVTNLSSPGISCINRRNSEVLPDPVLPIAAIVFFALTASAKKADQSRAS